MFSLFRFVFSAQVQFNRPVKAVAIKVVKEVTSEEHQQMIMAERLAIIVSIRVYVGVCRSLTD